MNKRITLILLLIFSIQSTFALDLNNGIIELGKIYRNFVFRNNPNELTFQKIDKINSSELKTTKLFIKECISPKNKLTSEEFLKLPDEITLLNLYLIMKVNANVRKKEPKDNIELLTEWRNKNVSRYELIENYYSMVFTGIGNKNQPFDLSNVDFVIDNYNLEDETEKGIFFLTAMNLCYHTIWGYMNVVKPPNYKKAKKNIEKFPKFNGQEYYKYLDFGFKDFKMKIRKDNDNESFKYFFINRFYNTLIYHHQCLIKKRRTRKKAENLALSSILKEKNYYEYSKNQNYLNGLFRTMKME
ncbi:hypothetical protein DS884_02575 [Tenacibaculum sp. E3R01]|uniref:hypothetical protein n=1 Tax=Tenacibaculum sp. E3R01 TaxID=2267227 RepID=UPI000DEA8884|nr:hypothetical protein [Tenacibaculum sp. E3R01]RBW61910.1 hypothetical protein DS884_02575 [Tenacibaculum sp. E3R01]